MALLVITGNREDTTADDGRIRTAKTVVISNAGQSEQVQTELVIDFERQVARFTGQPSLSSPDDPIAAVTISTPTRVYLQVPEPLRTRSKGKPWVAGPTIRDQVDELFDIGRLTDPERHLNEGPQGRVVRLGEEQIDGQQLVKFEIIDSVLPEARFFYWVDTFGRLARTQQEATSRGPGPIATATITYNEPADITIPDETAVFAVATADEADDVIRPSR